MFARNLKQTIFDYFEIDTRDEQHAFYHLRLASCTNHLVLIPSWDPRWCQIFSLDFFCTRRFSHLKYDLITCELIKRYTRTIFSDTLFKTNKRIKEKKIKKKRKRRWEYRWTVFSRMFTRCARTNTYKRKGRNEGKHFSIWHHSTRRRYVDRGNATALVSVSARCSTVNITVLSLLRTLLCLSNDDFVVKRRNRMKRDGTELNWKITGKKGNKFKR